MAFRGLIPANHPDHPHRQPLLISKRNAGKQVEPAEMKDLPAEDDEAANQLNEEDKTRALLQRLDASIRRFDRILGVSAADLPELTEEDHDRLALERINHRRTR